ncbi:T-cell ecto-ADP-ribosyltransferase 1-like [Leptodactylus fuscus]|uniref:T-cell ecto-ADP-ribosyltransferase 1-like n=1 Tax=Leptodactylus fuscus TaxID=238119 RepID=UPI003F4F3D16
MNQWNIFVLILFTFHLKTHLAQEIQLSDNPEIYDDQYKGCRLKMNKIIPGILKCENNSNDVFRYAWNQATYYWSSIKPYINNLPKRFRDEHGIALVAYTSNLYSAFNKATRDVGNSIEKYKNQFHFKAMHYYMTMALQMLSNKSKRLVYRGVRNIQFTPSKNSRIIRFGQFTSTSEDPAVAKKFGNTSFFTIETRLGADIQKFSMYSSEKEILIPGYELFKVTEFERQTHHFNLTSKGRTKSRFNCAYLKDHDPQMTDQNWNVKYLQVLNFFVIPKINKQQISGLFSISVDHKQGSLTGHYPAAVRALSSAHS